MGLTGLRPSSRKEHSKASKHKLGKKHQFYEKVKNSASASLGAKKSVGKKKRLRTRQKKLKAYDLSALSEFLPNLDSSQKQPKETNFKLNSKSRHQLVQKESAQLKAVLNHPAFQTDPLAAIHQHLERTQPPVNQEKIDQKQQKKKKKKINKKGSGGQSSNNQAMDV